MAHHILTERRLCLMFNSMFGDSDRVIKQVDNSNSDCYSVLFIASLVDIGQVVFAASGVNFWEL